MNQHFKNYQIYKVTKKKAYFQANMPLSGSCIYADSGKLFYMKYLGLKKYCLKFSFLKWPD